MSIAWLVTIGQERRAWVPYHSDGPPPRPGDLLRYYTKGANNDHVEWLLSYLDDNGEAEHGGGGRTDNAITLGRSNVLRSAGRPLVMYLDVDRLGLPQSPPSHLAA